MKAGKSEKGKKKGHMEGGWVGLEQLRESASDDKKRGRKCQVRFLWRLHILAYLHQRSLTDEHNQNEVY
jgi:hypothetical protein